MNNTSVTSFFHKHRNVTCHTYPDVCLLNAFIYKQTHTLFTYFLTKNLYITVYIYSVQVYMYFTSSLADTPPPPPAHMQDQLASNCSRTVYNDSTCQVWSCRVKPQRVQWPPGVWSQLWQMANAGRGSAELEAVWLITPPADMNTATGSVCRLPYSLSFHQTCSHCIPSLFLFFFVLSLVIREIRENIVTAAQQVKQ